jgi:hypothetical protein
VLSPDPNSLSFSIFTTFNIKNFVVLDINEVVGLIDKELEPS